MSMTIPTKAMALAPLTSSFSQALNLKQTNSENIED